ncbi:MliC family protein [Roseibium sp.]|uniref:MliC family protein n=1 Tax=Roseibium sp. TaxID=1936156 RepID=UPI003A96BC01
MRNFSGLLIFGLLAFSTSVQASPDVDFPQNGQSYGGKVRSGPGLQYRQVGSLGEGNQILILNGTGVLMDGYEWFQIRYGRGRTGYQWGGIFCSQTEYPGILTTCARGLNNILPPVQQGARQPASGGQNTSVQQVTPAFNGLGNGVNGLTVDQVFHSRGSFSNAGGGQWEELNEQGRVSFRFEERGRSDTAVYLFDASRNVGLQLNLQSRQVLYGQGNDPMQPLYTITNAIADVAAGGSAPVASPAARTVHYTCPEGLPLTVTFSDIGGANEHVTFNMDTFEGNRLARVRSGSGALYTDGVFSIHTKGNEAVFQGPSGSDRCFER